jgi:integrase
MTVDVRALLEDQLAEHERLKRDGRIVRYVFHRDGERIISLLKSWHAACAAAGCPGRIPHDLRRTAVRNLVRAGITERVAMKMTGHKTPSVFQRYNIVSDGDLREAARKLDVAVPALPLAKGH